MSSIASVFHAYDIRALSPQELDATFAERLGRVLAEVRKPKRVMVARDMRATSEDLEKALMKGLTEQGVDVTQIGLSSTPMFNVTMGLAEGRYDLGVMVTASHNPAEYNGFKFTDGAVYPIGQGTGMEAIRDRYLSEDPFVVVNKQGTVDRDMGALKRYLDHIFSFVDTASLPSMKIAVDAGNGMAGLILPELQKRLPQIEMLPLYWEMDGRFPNHEANPIKSETLVDVSRMVRDAGCALGVSYDGDGDRIGFVDESGNQITGDLLTALLAEPLLKTHPDCLVLYDVRCSWAVPESIHAHGGKSEMTRVGHAFIKRQLRDSGAIFGGELSMHFYFKDLWGVESGDYALLLLLQLLAQTGKSLSELAQPLQKYAHSGEINSRVEDPGTVISSIEEAYQNAASQITTIDGIRMDFGVDEDGSKSDDAWWFSLRTSNTEPVLRLIVEGVTEQVMTAKRDELLAMIRS
ncbi:phosphomannomutase/phosphoglucomutase [Candidatus Uhrbacteria bacterium]|nr:phosphomannomutase/phosphoglucomutase [Candidatus Uhrbacteria bacterium]MBD3284425.1 phosphomannomutase/phosphoglucomutase [Candidatus Uhrbacteria bacterium]